MTRIFQATPFILHEEVLLEERAFHHLINVLRLKKGETFLLFNGQGGEYQAQLTRIERKLAWAKIISYEPRERESNIKVCLGQSLIRNEKMDWIIQKAVELGISRITPLLTERIAVKWHREKQDKKLAHWQSVIIGACEQSGRNYLPQLDSPQSLHTWFSKVQADYRFLLSPFSLPKTSGLPSSLPKGASLALFIGPEGGLSRSEVDVAFENKFIPLTLGPRILRTETASLAAITFIQTQYGDMKSS